VNARRTVFAQLALVIALTLVGAVALAVLLGRVMVVRPAAEQIARAMDGFAGVVEARLHARPRDEVLAGLREAGFELHDTAPVVEDVRRRPLIRALRRIAAADALGAGRELRVTTDGRGARLWLKLDATPDTWVAFPVRERRDGAGRFPVAMLGACVVLVWLAAAYFARRLVQPLRQLAAAAPALVRGENAVPAIDRAPAEVAEVARALEKASREVREAAEERSLMLAGISHDLRTPLTRLQYALALVPEIDRELQAGMDRDIAEIDAVLSQFIAYARDGRDENAETLDLAEVCRSALAGGDAGWSCMLPDTAPMRGKPMALLRAVENLVVNAHRHGAPPYALALSRDGEAWCVEVADAGPGMPEALADRAQRPFVHGAGGGSGLGLAIVARVAHQHRGELRLLPNTPRGLRAQVWLRGA
jgi:two-component system, OmpR family, osmolarity sensor histidine kinase EnvZ